MFARVKVIGGVHYRLRIHIRLKITNLCVLIHFRALWTLDLCSAVLSPLKSLFASNYERWDIFIYCNMYVIFRPEVPLEVTMQKSIVFTRKFSKKIYGGPMAFSTSKWKWSYSYKIVFLENFSFFVIKSQIWVFFDFRKLARLGLPNGP